MTQKNDPVNRNDNKNVQIDPNSNYFQSEHDYGIYGVGLMMVACRCLSRANFDEKLSHFHRQLLTLILRIAIENRKSHVFIPRSYLANMLGVSVATVSSRISELKRRGYITIMKTTRSSGSEEGGNLYRVADKKKDIDFLEQALEDWCSSYRSRSDNIVSDFENLAAQNFQDQDPYLTDTSKTGKAYLTESSNIRNSNVTEASKITPNVTGSGKIRNANVTEASKINEANVTGPSKETTGTPLATRARSLLKKDIKKEREERKGGCRGENKTTPKPENFELEIQEEKKPKKTKKKIEPFGPHKIYKKPILWQETWEVPDDWKKWAFVYFVIEKEKILQEAEAFKSYYSEKTGQNFKEKWRRWMKASFKNYEVADPFKLSPNNFEVYKKLQGIKKDQYKFAEGLEEKKQKPRNIEEELGFVG